MCREYKKMLQQARLNKLIKSSTPMLVSVPVTTSLVGRFFLSGQGARGAIVLESSVNKDGRKYDGQTKGQAGYLF